VHACIFVACAVSKKDAISYPKNISAVKKGEAKKKIYTSKAV